VHVFLITNFVYLAKKVIAGVMCHDTRSYNVLT